VTELFTADGTISLGHPGSAVPTLVIVLGSTLLFVVYFYVLSTARLTTMFRASGLDEDEAQTRAVLLSKLSGGFLMGAGVVGIALALGLRLSQMGFVIPPVGASVLWILLGASFTLPAALLSARRPAFWQRYPEIRTQDFHRGIVIRSGIAWLVYLTGYELVFRGVLLFYVATTYGPWEAIAVSTGLYTLAHLHKDAAETIACLPMGVFFSVMALSTAGPWSVIALHWLIAMTGESAAAHRNPDTTWWSVASPVSSRPAPEDTVETATPEAPTEKSTSARSRRNSRGAQGRRRSRR